MHCASCTLLIKEELSELKEVKSVRASLSEELVEIEGDFGEATNEAVAKVLTQAVQAQGYTISTKTEHTGGKWQDFKIAIPLAVLFVALFVGMQKLGLVNLVTTAEVTYGTAFIIGMIASVSTCMAVVGGLVLSLSAHYAKTGDRVRPQALFHISRLVAFFVLGGIIGALGTVFKIGAAGTIILSILVAVILLILGVNLLDVFPWIKKIQPTLPQFLGSRVYKLKELNHTLTPVLMGAATFFLPCGFTQSMQIYTLTTGGFMPGALTMLAYALGTLPVLALLSFSSLAIQTSSRSGVFFKTAGLVVIFFGLFNLHYALVAAGVITPLFSL